MLEILILVGKSQKFGCGISNMAFRNKLSKKGLPPRTNPGPMRGFGKRKGPLWQERITQSKILSNIFARLK